MSYVWCQCRKLVFRSANDYGISKSVAKFDCKKSLLQEDDVETESVTSICRWDEEGFVRITKSQVRKWGDRIKFNYYKKIPLKTDQKNVIELLIKRKDPRYLIS